MEFELVVTEPFKLGGTRYARGDAITDPGTVETVQRDFPNHVVRRLPAAKQEG